MGTAEGRLISMTSLWLDRTDTFSGDEFRQGEAYDTVVVGAGLTGLVTALLLARSGQNVLVLEARSPGAVATGNTTAKVTLLQGTVLSGLRRQYSARSWMPTWQPTARGRPGCCGTWKPAGCRSRNATLTPTPPRRRATEIASQGTRRGPGRRRRGGLCPRTPGCPSRCAVPCASRGQAQINPMDVVLALAEDVRSHGGTIVSGVRVQNVSGTDPSTVETDHGAVRANRSGAGHRHAHPEPRPVLRQTQAQPLVRRGDWNCPATPCRRTACICPWSSPSGHCGITPPTGGACCWWAATDIPWDGRDRNRRTWTRCWPGRPRILRTRR